MRMPKLKDLPKHIRPFEFMGVHLDAGDEQYNGTCPFCNKDQHFYISVETGQWDCKACGQLGNILGFYRAVFEESLSRFIYDGQTWKGLSETTLERFKVCKSFLTDEWMIPYFSIKDEDLLTFGIQIPELGKELKYPPGLDHVLFNAHTIGTDVSTPIIICEGPTDAMALDAYLRRHGARKDYYVVAAPSANTFKDQWCILLKGRDVRIWFDNDTAGITGRDRLLDLFRMSPNAPKHVAYLEWPKITPEGYDVRDTVQSAIPGEEPEIEEVIEEIEDVILMEEDDIVEIEMDEVEDLTDERELELVIE